MFIHGCEEPLFFGGWLRVSFGNSFHGIILLRPTLNWWAESRWNACVNIVDYVQVENPLREKETFTPDVIIQYFLAGH